MQLGARVVDRFEVTSRIGAGSTGTIYRARDLEAGGEVALKVVRGVTPAVAGRFTREAQALAQLEHPGIVRYVAHGPLAGGDAFLAMEWLEGENLAARLRRERMTPQEALRVAIETARALDYAHARGLVHRDIKPSNLHLRAGTPVTVRPQVVIVDFGLARGDADATLTRSGTFVGTPGYLSPEQAQGRRLDGRSDLFSLGCVLFRSVTGRPPFDGRDVLDVMSKLLFSPYPRVQEVDASLPYALDALVARMMARRAEARPASAGLAADAMESLLETLAH